MKCETSMNTIKTYHIMSKKYIVLFSVLLLILFAFSACQKVIDIDLNAVKSKIVIEAEITDQPGPYTFKITKTANFNESNNFPAVSGASVKISDNAGNSETLTETTPGIYVTTTFQGIPGRTYFLEITSEGTTYTSSSKMPEATSIDTLLTQTSFFGGGKMLNAYFKDSAGISNYYRLLQTVNNTLKKNITIIEDNFQDGETITSSFLSFGADSLSIGDTIKIFLQSIDKATYEYFRTLSMLTGGGGPPSDAPANPISNITNGALGYFSAYAVRTKTIVIQ